MIKIFGILNRPITIFTQKLRIFTRVGKISYGIEDF